MNDENDPLGFLDEMGVLPEFKDGYWSRRVAATGALQELAGLQGARGDVEPIDQQFLRFAQCVAAAYVGLDDKEIVEAKETPELMRYLVKALGDYAARATSRANLDAGGRVKTADRYRVLADVFLASGGHGGSRKGKRRDVWTQRRIESAIEAYRGFLYERAGWDNHDNPEWQARAFEAAYKKVFGGEVRDEPREQKDRDELERELVKHAGMAPLIPPKKARRIKLT